jgi:hypothetical protein
VLAAKINAAQNVHLALLIKKFFISAPLSEFGQLSKKSMNKKGTGKMSRAQNPVQPGLTGE